MFKGKSLFEKKKKTKSQNIKLKEYDQITDQLLCALVVRKYVSGSNYIVQIS